MLRPELALAAPSRPFEPARVAPPQPLASPGSAPPFAQLQAEIAAFIDQGTPFDDDRVARPALVPAPASAALGAPVVAALAPARAGVALAPREAFLQSIAPWAEEAGERLGVAPDILAAQAALESGWGRRPLRDAAGADTHNLFGIKAGEGWRGASVEVLTTEVADGVASKQRQRFRRYADPGEAFRDLTELLRGNPRYQGALDVGPDARAYAEALAQGGYATDPDYAAKLAAVVARLRAGKGAAPSADPAK